MLPIKNIRFRVEELPDGKSKVTATLELNVEGFAASREPAIGIEELKRMLVHKMWDAAYGDELRRTISELRRFALLYAPSGQELHAQELCAKINDMLTCDGAMRRPEPSPADVLVEPEPVTKEESRLFGGITRVKFWAQVIELLPFMLKEQRVIAVQELISKVGPCPDSLGEAVRAGIAAP